jgi:ligand-binding sensor domain-containing protein
MHGDQLDLRGTVGRDFQSKTAFLYCELLTEQAGNVELRLSCRPEATLWMNGTRLERGDYLYDEDYKGKGTWVYEVNTRAGTNGILLAVSQLGLDPGLALRVLPPERAVLRGRVLNARGHPIPQQARLALWEGDQRVSAVRTAQGYYRISVLPKPGVPYDLACAYQDEGTWRLAEPLAPGSRREMDIQLSPAVSLAGTVTMLDKARSPHRQIVVQALHSGRPFASTLSDDKGAYQFINLRPGDYEVRCLTPGRVHAYEAPGRTDASLRVDARESHKDIDFRFPGFKRGVWSRQTAFDGLPSNRLRGLAGSPRGELWVATDAGLAHFDGSRWRTVPGTEGREITAIVVTPNADVWFGTYAGLFHLAGARTESFGTREGLPDEYITSLLCTRRGELWVGTEYGLSRFDSGRFRTFTFQDGLAQNHVNALTEGTDGSLWVGTGSGLARYDGKQFQTFTSQDGLPSNEINAIDASAGSQLLVATSGGLAEWREGRFIPRLTSPGHPAMALRTITRSSDGRIWLGTDQGVGILDGDTLGLLLPEDGLAGKNVLAIQHAPDGGVWLATENGLARLDPESATYTSSDGLPEGRVFDLSATPDGLWVGTEWGGLGRWTGGAFTTVLPGLYVRKLHAGPDGRVWACSDKGAFPVDAPTSTSDRWLANRWVMAMDIDASGGFWFGDGWSGGGLVHLAKQPNGGYAQEVFTTAQGLPDNQVNAIRCQAPGTVWVGTSRGLARFDGRNFASYGEDQGLPNRTIRALLTETNGVGLWIGTDAGLAHYDGRSIRNITRQSDLPPSRIWCIHRSKDGLIWFGTESRGLFAFDGEAFSTFDTRDGLPDDLISAIAEDGRGNLWLGTSRGGVTTFRRKTTPPSVQIRQLHSSGASPAISLTTPLPIRVNETLSVGFETSDWTTLPSKRQYRVRLSPARPAAAEPVIHRITSRSELDWTPTSPGDYRLEVQAIGQHLIYSEPASLMISVFAPWHEQTRWRALAGTVLLLLLAASGSLVANNLKQRREARRLRDLMLEQERSARIAMEEKNQQLEQGAENLRVNQRRLEEALANVKTLRGLLPICAACKRIRDDRGFWQQLEIYFQSHSEARFSHGMCPDCVKKWYPDLHQSPTGIPLDPP